MRPLLLLAFAALGGCAVPTTASTDLARAQRADALGHEWMAGRLYRAAARGGSLDAQVYLAANHAGTRPQSVAERLVSPDADERALWRRAAHATAERLAAAGSPDGHRALGDLAWPDAAGGPQPAPSAYTEARVHFASAAALGDARAAHSLAMAVWIQDGLLASEPHFRTSFSAGNEGAAGLLSMIAFERPALERGKRGRDAPGDLSRLDVVGGMRTLREVDPGAAEARLSALRSQAGTADADSLVRVLGAAGLL